MWFYFFGFLRWWIILSLSIKLVLIILVMIRGHSENQPWDFFGRNDAKAETPVLWPPHAKSWLNGKDFHAGRDWGQEEKGTIENEMAGWHHWLDGRESEWTLGVGDGQGGLACCDSWGCKESDTTERLNRTELNVALGFPGDAVVKNLPAGIGDAGSVSDPGDPLEKEMATRSGTLTWKIPWMEKPGKLQSIGSQRVGHDWASSLSLSDM